MKNSLLFIFLFLLGLNIVSAQVKVRGYYKKNGTYVQPHYRSNPDGNPYNNYSYPGNVNPFTGNVAKGSTSNYLENYSKKNASSSNSEFSLPANTYIYKAKINALSNVPLRELPNINSKEIYKCNEGDFVYVLDASGPIYYKVNINGNIGYLSKGFINMQTTQATNTNSPETTTTPAFPSSNQSIITNEEHPPASNSYKYRTRLDAYFDTPLRELPEINAKVIYMCPKSSYVYVIDNSGPVYFKVNVNGYIGYLSKSFIKDKN